MYTQNVMQPTSKPPQPLTPQSPQTSRNIRAAASGANVTYTSTTFLQLQSNLRILSHTVNVRLSKYFPQRSAIISPNSTRNDENATAKRLPTAVNPQTLTIFQPLQTNQNSTVFTVCIGMNVPRCSPGPVNSHCVNKFGKRLKLPIRIAINHCNNLTQRNLHTSF